METFARIGHSKVDFICQNWYFVLLRNPQKFELVFFGESHSTRIGRVDNIDSLSPLIDLSLNARNVRFEVLISLRMIS